MDLRQNDIIRSIPHETIIILKKDDMFTVYTSSTKVLKQNKLEYEEYVRKNITSKAIKEYTCVKDDIYNLEKSSTPSNWNDFLDILSEKVYNPISCITIANDKISIAFYSYAESKVFYKSFVDDDIFSHLYSFLTEINCNDAIIINLKLQKILLNMGMNVIHQNDKLEDRRYVDDDDVNHAIEALLKHLRIKDANLSKYKETKFMRLDRKTLANLDMHHVIDMIKPVTQQGRRYLNQLMRQPVIELHEIKRRQDYVRDLFKFDNKAISGFYDLLKLTKKILKLKVSEICTLYRSIMAVENIINGLQKDCTELVKNDFVVPLQNIRNTHTPLVDEMLKIINLENETLNVEVSELIYTLKEEKEEILLYINEELEAVAQTNRKVRLEEKNDDFFYFKVPRSEYKFVKENAFVEKSVLKGGILFTNLQLEKYNERLENINKEYKIEEKKILDNFLMYLNNFSASFEVINYIVAMIDVYSTFSQLQNRGYNLPDFGDFFDIEGAFHPLVQECITNSLKIDNDKRFCTITGPNMGGKSTFIKLCGIICILGQMGCPVPCRKATLSIIDGIYVRIGANDILTQGMSTFMVEMNDMARICKNVDSNSLVIIDELGRGTSAIDGLSIALSIKEYLMKKNALTLFATHFTEVCCDKSCNKRMSCEIDENGLNLLYKLEDGVSSESLGINVAQQVGFPEEVVRLAKQYLRE